MTIHEASPVPAGENLAHPWLVALVVGLGTLFSAMAGSAVGVTLPELSRELGIAVDEAGWVMLSYLLGTTIFLLLAGRVGDLIGHRRVYLAGYFVFGVMSLAAGLAGNIWLLAAARVVQGVGGSLVMAAGPALLTTSFPEARRGQALGTVATATYVGLTIGPSLGGWLVHSWGWRWIFFINVPPTAAIGLLGLIYLPITKPAPRSRIDTASTVLLLAGLLPFILTVVEGPRWGAQWLPTAGCAAAGLVFLTAFARRQTRLSEPLLNLDLFRSRVFSGAVLSALANYLTLFVATFLLPYYLIEGLGLDYRAAGLLLTAQPLAMALVAAPAGMLSDRIGTRGLAAGGMMLLAVGMFGLATLGPASTPREVVAFYLAIGLGTGVFISPNSSAIMGAAPRERQGTAAGVTALARNLGMLLGVATATAVFQLGGGDTGRIWTTVDYHAMRRAFLVAACVGLLAAFFALLAKAPVEKEA